MIRFGTSRADYQTRHSPGLSLHALCMSVIQSDLRLCRIPAAYITPLAEATAAPLRALLRTYGIRLIVHAPLTNPDALETWFADVIAFFADLDATDAVIVCHLPDWSPAGCAALARMPGWVRRHLAVELTDQPPEVLVTRLAACGVPVVYDTLHYQQQVPWPFEPIPMLFTCLDSWGERTPLMHLSSQSTTMRPDATLPAPGQHGDVLDTGVAVWYLRALLESRRAVDIEIEATSGVVAYTHLQRALQRSMQKTRPTAREWIRHA